ncbi:MAG: serine hydrolase, partial [Candidatus Curtissbacteria bacterium]
LFAKSPSTIISPAGPEETIPQRIAKIITGKSPLAKAIEIDFKGAAPETYAIVIKNFKNGQEYRVNENKQFTAASLYKLWVMAVAFEKVKAGTLKEDQVLTMTTNELDKIQETAPRGDGSISMSVADAIERMIIVSDNDAATLLYTRIGVGEVSDFLTKNGFTGSAFGSPPKTSAKDIANFYEKLYKGAVVDRQYSDRMLALLSRQRINDKLPKYLPEEVKIAHKTGELENFEHDAGIVYLESGDYALNDSEVNKPSYIIVVLTQANDPVTGSETVAKLSKAVYEYFTKSPQP